MKNKNNLYNVSAEEHQLIQKSANTVSVYKHIKSDTMYEYNPAETDWDDHYQDFYLANYQDFYLYDRTNNVWKECQQPKVSIDKLITTLDLFDIISNIFNGLMSDYCLYDTENFMTFGVHYNTPQEDGEFDNKYLFHPLRFPTRINLFKEFIDVPDMHDIKFDMKIMRKYLLLRVDVSNIPDDVMLKLRNLIHKNRD